MSRGREPGRKKFASKKGHSTRRGNEKKGRTAKKQEGGKSAKSAMIPFAPHASPFVEGSEIDLETCNLISDYGSVYLADTNWQNWDPT